jgi:hypothetical protein
MTAKDMTCLIRLFPRNATKSNERWPYEGRDDPLFISHFEELGHGLSPQPSEVPSEFVDMHRNEFIALLPDDPLEETYRSLS